MFKCANSQIIDEEDLIEPRSVNQMKATIQSIAVSYSGYVAYFHDYYVASFAYFYYFSSYSYFD